MLLDEIEPGVRKLVKCLRDYGINTECSCHDDWYVQCQSLDPTTNLDNIWMAMHDMDIREYTVELLRTVLDGQWKQHIEIRFSPTMQMLHDKKEDFL